jgi:hypothetical protein
MLNRTVRHNVRSCLCILATVASFVALVGCRNEDASEPYNRDLGEGGDILLPVGSPILNARVASGSAEFPQFRDPSEEPAELTPEDEIRDLIAVFNDEVESGNYDELERFIAPRQREDVKALIDFAVTLLEKTDELADALIAAVPDQEERIEGLVDETLRRQTGILIRVAALEVVSETKVIGKLPPDEVPPLPGFVPEIHFEFLDEEESGEGEWYIVDPNLELQKSMLPLAEAGLTQINAMIEGIKTGNMPAEQILGALEAQAQAAKAIAGGSEAPEPSEAAEAGEETDEGDEKLTEDEEEGDEELDELDEGDQGDEEPEEEEEEPTPPPVPGG